LDLGVAFFLPDPVKIIQTIHITSSFLHLLCYGDYNQDCNVLPYLENDRMIDDISLEVPLLPISLACIQQET
jgi:hypothetical protein